MAKSRRELQREQTTAEIKAVARVQMAETGTAALSLRAIAREMGMSAPALYRYFANRDALVTALIVDAYNAIADAMAVADGTVDELDFYGRFQAIAQAFRAWALQNPADFTLIYGTPIPNYHAPREITVPVAVRVLELFGVIFTAAYEQGKLQTPAHYAQLPTKMVQLISELHQQLDRPEIPEFVITLTLYVLPRIYGLVWAELYEHLPPNFAELGEFYTLEVTAMCAQFGLIR